MKNTLVDETTLQRVKTTMRAGLIYRLDDNAGLAQQLASNYATYGDWRKMFTEIEEINKVTAADVQRVAKTYLVEKSRTVVWIASPPAKAEAAKGDKQ